MNSPYCDRGDILSSPLMNGVLTRLGLSAGETPAGVQHKVLVIKIIHNSFELLAEPHNHAPDSGGRLHAHIRSPCFFKTYFPAQRFLSILGTHFPVLFL